MKYFFLICTFFLVLADAAESAPKKKTTICLNMIVKNESQVIEKCLNSVKPLIDYWVIVDTGSTDGTQEIIKKCMKGIPGKLYQKSWKNFAHNRNEALALAKNKGDYVLLIDADEVLQISDDFLLPELEKDIYYIPVRIVGLAECKRNGIINNRLNWKWEGEIHERIRSPDIKSCETLKGILNLCNTNDATASGRNKESKAAKYLRDAALLEKALKKDPSNSRYAYYLGASYVGAGKYEMAKEKFEKRLAMPSPNVEETFMTLYYLGCLHEKLKNFDAALESFSKAYVLRPSRAEPLFRSAIIQRQKGDVLRAYQLIKHALSLPYPEGDYHVFYLAYDYEMQFELINSAVQLGRFNEVSQVCRQLLKNPRVPEDLRPFLQSNLELAQKKLQEIVPSP